MEEDVYTVSAEIMSEVFDFQNGVFFKGREHSDAWTKFFESSTGPKKWIKEKLYSKFTGKIRVQHATITKDRKSQCPALSILTIGREKLVETANDFEFAVSSARPVNSICTCLCKYFYRFM